jgi:uncharacterized OB-fold protein
MATGEQCPECGATIRPGGAACPDCGTELVDPEPEETNEAGAYDAAERAAAIVERNGWARFP